MRLDGPTGRYDPEIYAAIAGELTGLNLEFEPLEDVMERIMDLAMRAKPRACPECAGSPRALGPAQGE